MGKGGFKGTRQYRHSETGGNFSPPRASESDHFQTSAFRGRCLTHARNPINQSLLAACHFTLSKTHSLGLWLCKMEPPRQAKILGN